MRVADALRSRLEQLRGENAQLEELLGQADARVSGAHPAVPAKSLSWQWAVSLIVSWTLPLFGVQARPVTSVSHMHCQNACLYPDCLFNVDACLLNAPLFSYRQSDYRRS